MMRGIILTSGSCWSFSQVRYVNGLTPSCEAAWRWKRPSSRRRLRRCSPRVSGASLYGLGFNDFSKIGPNGKKATRLCRCGHLDDAGLACGRAPKCAQEYQSRISGPLFDRIDLHIDVPAVNPSDLALPPPAEGSAEIAVRVAAARARQSARYAGMNGATIRTNAEVEGEALEAVAAPDAEGRALLTQAAERFKLTARGYHRVMRVARTIADLEAAPAVRRIHIAEALSYRRIVLGR